MKPQLADDWCEDKLQFPLIAQPKIDGVRALNLTGNLTGRSLKKFKNVYTTNRYSNSALLGFDGEMAAHKETHPDLCRLTTSALSTIKGEPYVLWWLFDLVRTDTKDLPYIERYHKLLKEINRLRDTHTHLWHHMRIMPFKVVNCMDELEAIESRWLADGYEGVILRRPDMPLKQGRSGKKPYLWRIKRFVDFEVQVHSIIQGQHNANEAKTNKLGHTERSTHQANMIPNGMVGAILASVVTEAEIGGVKFQKGQEVRIGPGRLTHEQRKYFFEHQHKLINKVIKVKVFPQGIKDKLRFPTFQSFRDPIDMS